MRIPRPNVVIPHIHPPTVYTPERWETSFSQKPDVRDNSHIYICSVGSAQVSAPEFTALQVLGPEFSLQSDPFIWDAVDHKTRHSSICVKYAIPQIIHFRSLDSQIRNQTLVPVNQVHQDYLYGQRYGTLFCIWIYHGLPRQWAYRTRKTVLRTGNWNLK